MTKNFFLSPERIRQAFSNMGNSLRIDLGVLSERVESKVQTIDGKTMPASRVQPREVLLNVDSHKKPV